MQRDRGGDSTTDPSSSNPVKNILSLSAAHLMTDIYGPVLPAILPLLILQGNMPYFAAALIVTTFNLTSSFTQPLMGWLYDRRGIAVPVAFSVLLGAIFIPLIGILTNYWLMLVAASIAALGHAFFHPSALGMVSKLAGGVSRGRLTSYFVVGGNLGFALGPVFAGLAVGFFGLHGVLLLTIPGVLFAAILLFLLPTSASSSSLHHSSEGVGTLTATRSQWAAISTLLAAAALRSWVIFSSIAFLPTFLTTAGLDLVWANMLVSGMLLAGVAGQVFGGAVSDRYGRKEYTLLGIGAAVIPFTLFLSTDGVLSLAALILFGFLLWSTFSVTLAMAHEIMPGNAGTVSGLFLGLAVGFGGGGVAVTGYIADIASLNTAIWSLLIPIIASLVLFGAAPYPWRRKG